MNNKSRTRPYVKTARNSRKAVHKYYYIDDIKRFAAKAGRCYKCNKITDAYCDKCGKWVCKKHMFKPDKEDYLCYCLECK
ncbi:hypothetical protein KY361_04015 [Candidatus Woesearchaeota archaeon]|nr:hypothetical protein [Candidatus Woesearchaeota archaeon]